MQQQPGFQEQLSDVLDAPSDLKEAFSGLTIKAFAMPVSITSDEKFSQEFKAYKQQIYKADEKEWSYAVPGFERSEQKSDPYLQQMAVLIDEFKGLARNINEAIRQEIVELLQTHPEESVRKLAVGAPPVDELISPASGGFWHSLAHVLHQQGFSQTLKQWQSLLSLVIDTSRYTLFQARFGEAGAFIGTESKFDADRERFYRSTKMKLETILYYYQRQYQECLAPSVSAASKKMTLSSIGSFLREVQQQALACQDGMAFIGDTYDELTKTDNPAGWLLELRAAIVTAIVPGAKLITGDGGYQVHAQTAVEREAAKLGYGVKCLPYKDRHEGSPQVHDAMIYAQGRLLVEFPFNYNYETICDYVAQKLQHLVKEAVQDYKGQVMMCQGERQPAYDELRIKLSHPPLSFSGLAIDRLLVRSAEEDVYRIDERLLGHENIFDLKDPSWSLYFIKQAQNLLLGLGIIQSEEKLEDTGLFAALVDAIEQRQLYRLSALLQYPRASAVVSPDLIKRALDKKSNKSKFLPLPRSPREAPYQKKETWQPQLALQLLLDKLPDTALEPKSADDNLLVIAIRNAECCGRGFTPFTLIVDTLVKRLAPGLSSVVPPLPVPAKVSLLEQDGEDEQDEEDENDILESKNSSETKGSKRRGDPASRAASQVALLRGRAKRLTAYANQSPAGSGKSRLTLLTMSIRQIYEKRMWPITREMSDLLGHIPNLELPIDRRWHQVYGVADILIHQLRGIKTKEEIKKHQCHKKVYPGMLRDDTVSIWRYELVIKKIYYQGGIGALALFQILSEPVATQKEAENREVVLDNLLELARYVAVDLSVPRWLETSSGLQKMTPLMAALRSDNSQQFLQLLALGADPTMEQKSTSLLIFTATPRYPDALFEQLVHRVSLVFKGQEDNQKDNQQNSQKNKKQDNKQDKQQDKKVSDFANRRSPDGSTALSIIIQHQQLNKLLFLFTRFKDLDTTSLPERQLDNACWTWLDLVVAIRKQDYTAAIPLFLKLYESVKTDQLDVQLERSYLSADDRRNFLTEQNKPLLAAQACLLCHVVQQQCGDSALPFLTQLAQQIADVDLLLDVSEHTEAKIDFNAPRPAVQSLQPPVESLLHRAIQQRLRGHVKALLKKGADPLQCIEGYSALFCAVKTGDDWLIVNEVMQHPRVRVDQVDAKGKHLLCYAAESFCSPQIFSRLIKKFMSESEEEREENCEKNREKTGEEDPEKNRETNQEENREEKGIASAAKQTQVLLAVAQQLLQDQDRQQPQQIEKIIQLLTRLDSALLPTSTTVDDRKDAVHSLLHCIQAAKAQQWQVAIEYYWFYAWQMGIGVDEDLDPEIEDMLDHQQCGELRTQLAAQRTQPTGLMQVRALLCPVIEEKKDEPVSAVVVKPFESSVVKSVEPSAERVAVEETEGEMKGETEEEAEELDPDEAAAQRVALALTQFTTWVSDDTSGEPRPLLQSLHMLKYFCVPQDCKERDNRSTRIANFVALCRGVMAQVSDRYELVAAILSLIVEIDVEAVADSFLQQDEKASADHKASTDPINPIDHTDTIDDVTQLLSRLQSLKAIVVREHSRDVYADLLCRIVQRLGKRLTKDIHHYPDLFTFILQEMTDLHRVLFTHSSDDSSDGHTVYYSPLGYAVKAQLAEPCQDYITRHRRGDEVGMQAVDSGGRTPLMLAASMSWERKEYHSYPSVPTSVPVVVIERERKSEVISSREQQIVEQKTGERKERKELEVKEREEKERDVKEPEVKQKEVKEIAPVATSILLTTPLTILDQLLSATPPDQLCAVDSAGNSVLHHAILGPLENFVTIAHYVQKHVSREQWLALVRQPNKAGATILSQAVAQQSIEKVLSFLAMDIDVATLDVTSCQKLQCFPHLYPLLQEIKAEHDVYMKSDFSARSQVRASWKFAAFESLWQAMREGQMSVTPVMFQQLLQVFTRNGSFANDFLNDYMLMMIQRHLTLIPQHHPVEPLWMLLHECTLKRWEFLDEQSLRFTSPVLFVLKHGYEDLAARFIKEEIEQQSNDLGRILNQIGKSECAEEIFIKAVALYQQYGGCAILNKTEIIHELCLSRLFPPKSVLRVKYLLTVEGIDLIAENRVGMSILEGILRVVSRNERTLQKQDISTIDREECSKNLADWIELRDDLLKNEVVLRYQYQKYHAVLKKGEVPTAMQTEAAVWSLHHLIRLSHLNLEAELQSLDAATTNKNVVAQFAEKLAEQLFTVRYSDMASAVLDPQLLIFINYCSSTWLNAKQKDEDKTKTLLELAIAHNSPLLPQLLSCDKVIISTEALIQLITQLMTQVMIGDSSFSDDQVTIALSRFVQQSSESDQQNLVSYLQKTLFPTPDVPTLRSQFLQQLYKVMGRITTDKEMALFAVFCERLLELKDPLWQVKDFKLCAFLGITSKKFNLVVSEHEGSRLHKAISHQPIEYSLAYIDYYQQRCTPSEWSTICNYRICGNDTTALYQAVEKGDARLVQAMFIFESKTEHKDSTESKDNKDSKEREDSKDSARKGGVTVLDKEAFCKTTQMTAPLAFYNTQSGIGACLKQLKPLFAQEQKDRDEKQPTYDQLDAALQALNNRDSKSTEVNETVQQLWGKDYAFTPLDVHIAHLKQLLMAVPPYSFKGYVEFLMLAYARPEAADPRYQQELISCLPDVLSREAKSGEDKSEGSLSRFLELFAALSKNPLWVERLHEHLQQKLRDSVLAGDLPQVKWMMRQVLAAEQKTTLSLINISNLIFTACEGTEIPKGIETRQGIEIDKIHGSLVLDNKVLGQPPTGGVQGVLSLSRSSVFHPPAKKYKLTPDVLNRFDIVSELITHGSWQVDAMDSSGRSVFIRVAMIVADYPQLAVICTELFTQLLKKCPSQIMLYQDATSSTVMDYLLKIGEAKQENPLAHQLQHVLAAEFKQLIRQLSHSGQTVYTLSTHLPSSGGGGSVRLFKNVLLPCIEPKAIRELALQIAVEMVKYYSAVHGNNPAHKAAAANLRAYLQSGLSQSTALDPAVWQIPELSQLLTALGLTKPGLFSSLSAAFK